MDSTKVEMVAHTLKIEILSRRRGNGVFLDSEWALAHRFGVNRHTVREACERLIGAGLIYKQFGEGLWILPEERWPLELIADEVLALRDLKCGLLLVDDVLRFHLLHMEEIAGLAAERHGAADLSALDLAYFELQRAISWQDDLLIGKKEEELTLALVHAAASRALSLSLRSYSWLIESLDLRRPPFAPWNSLTAWRSLIDCVRERRGSTARILTREMLERVHQAVRSSYLRRYPPAELVSPAKPGTGTSAQANPAAAPQTPEPQATAATPDPEGAVDSAAPLTP